METWNQRISFSDKMPQWFHGWSAREQKRYLDLGEYPAWYSTSGSLENTLMIVEYDSAYKKIPKWWVLINNSPYTKEDIIWYFGVSVTFFKKWKSWNIVQHRKLITPKFGKYKWQKIYVVKAKWWYLLYQKTSTNKLGTKYPHNWSDQYSDYLRNN